MFPPTVSNMVRNGPVAQLVRALACHARGRRFETVPGRHFSPKSGSAGFHIFASVAQLVEQRSPKPRAEGSSPSAPAMKKALAFASAFFNEINPFRDL